MENKVEAVNKIILLLTKWKDDVSILGNETAYSDDILRSAKILFEELLTTKNILYVCDGKQCKECSNECIYTSDIEHAKNFNKERGIYIEED